VFVIAEFVITEFAITEVDCIYVFELVVLLTCTTGLHESFCPIFFPQNFWQNDFSFSFIFQSLKLFICPESASIASKLWFSWRKVSLSSSLFTFFFSSKFGFQIICLSRSVAVPICYINMDDGNCCCEAVQCKAQIYLFKL